MRSKTFWTVSDEGKYREVGKVVHGMEQNNALKLHGKIKDSLHVLSMFPH